MMVIHHFFYGTGFIEAPVKTEHEFEGLVVAIEPVIEKPPLYAVVLYNDDFTPMDFVIDVLCRFFRVNHETATEIMLNVHYKGKGTAGIFPKDIALTKCSMVMDYARSAEHPLLCDIEPFLN